MNRIVRAGASAVLVSGMAIGAARAETTEVPVPDSFERPGRVESSITKMEEALAGLREGNWKAQRAHGICQDAHRRLADYVTSQVYTPELGEKIWRECHKAYTDVKP
jgi:hypothetical protein